MQENTLLHLKHKIESILFSAARKLSIQELIKLTRGTEEDILRCLREQKKELEEKGSSIILIEDSLGWQLTVKDKYISVIKKVVSKTEMPKTIIETLAVIAYKAPVLQSEIIKIRTNKGYDHIRELEKQGFLSREKKGRTKLIRLTPKFYDYFNLDPRQVKKAFKTVVDEEKAITEEEIKVYEVKKETKPQLSKDMKPYNKEIEGFKTYEDKKEDMKKKKHKEKIETKEKEEKGIEITPEQEKKVDEKVKELLGIKKAKKK